MNIAVWYHCVLDGPRIPSHRHAVSVMEEQMRALAVSRLVRVANEIHIGHNGSDSNSLLALSLSPANSILHHHPNGETELTTIADLRAWLKPGWFVLYHHIKGVQFPGNEIWRRWRHCMTRACVWNWQDCVAALSSGKDMAGAHWMTCRKWPMIPSSQQYWGGNFWWAKSDYLLKLPKVPEDCVFNRYEAEVWVGRCEGEPKTLDFANHFPMRCP